MTRLRRTPVQPVPLVALVLAVAGLVLTGLLVAPVQAVRAGTPAVGGLTQVGQDWPQARLKVRWTRVSGATYQVRWSTSTTGLARAKAQAARSNAATSPVLGNRCVPWYAQVRAVRSGKAGPWSRARAVRFTRGAPSRPAYATTVQTSTAAARVTWGPAAYVARYRLDWSAAPYGYWAGFEHNYTPWAGATSRGTSVQLPAEPAPKDRFIAPAYGNPVFAQLQYDNGCMGTPHRTTYFPVFPKAPATADGDLLTIGSYNLEGTPSVSKGMGRKLSNIADNIAQRDLDVLALQEANAQSAADLVDRLPGGAEAWDHAGVGAQQVLWRTAAWQAVPDSLVDVGQPNDGDARTPLPTPAIRLTPAVPDPVRQDIVVVSAHLEDPGEKNATVKQRKAAAHSAATILLRNLDAYLADGSSAAVPTFVVGDLKGNFSTATESGFCDENNGCQPEGQPTFVRAGFWDARTAATKVGIEYGSVNKHDPTPPASTSGVGARADFVLARNAGGFTFYRNVVKTYGDASATQQPDHNLLLSRVVVPRIPEPVTP